MNLDPLIQRDLKHVWHPCAQMKDFEACPPIHVTKAKGCYLHTPQGPLIDGIASWWCKSLGHAHPEVIAAIEEQLQAFEHVISANTTHPLLVELAEKLSQLTQKQHVFFASDGSSAVEIALKLAIHANQLMGKSERTRFVALKNSYHGETLATLSVSDVGRFKAAYQQHSMACHFLQSIPYVSGQSDPLWQNAEAAWQNAEEQLSACEDTLCAILVEPIVQGAGGLLCYSADFLRRLGKWARDHGILLIADEIMTGLCRTGKWLACEHAGISPDIICLSKGLTSGSVPMSCVMIDNAIFSLFYDDYSKGKSFLHSHTYSGNALGVAAAVATLNVMQREELAQQATLLGKWMTAFMTEIAQESKQLTNVRSVGALVAADLNAAPGERKGFQFYQEALKRGALLRPLGNTLYWLPPLTMSRETLEELARITLSSIEAVYR